MCDLCKTLAALALCAALLAGCTGGSGAASGSGSGAATPSAEPSAMPGTQTMAPTAAPDASAAPDTMPGAASSGTDAAANGAAYSADGLNTVLGGIVGYAADTAGGSLKTATAAGELVNFAANAGTASATLGADTKAWLDTLTDDQKAALRANWDGVRDMANGIAADPNAQSGVLADAGVTYDFAHMDMGGVQAFVNTVDSVLGAY